MGCSFMKRCYGTVTETKYISMNPNPSNFKIEKMIELENTYVEVFYPDAKNYEGQKVMVYRGRVAEQIMRAKELDPHFAENGLGPIARFAPTIEGKLIAMQLAKTILSPGDKP